MTLVGERLLATISARERISQRGVNEVLQELFSLERIEPTNPSLFMWRTLRNLEALGHIEVDDSPSKNVRICASSLLRLPWIGKPSYLLSGRRGLNAEETLQAQIDRQGLEIESVSESITIGEGSVSPNRLLLRTGNELQMEELGRSLGIAVDHYPAALRMLSQAGSLDEYESTLKFSHPEIDGRNPLAIGDPSEHRIFSRNERRFRHQNPQEPYPKLLRFPKTYGTGKNYSFEKADRSYAEVRPNWGRYLYLREYGANPFIFDSKAQIFFTPFAMPIPLVFDRALTLCSGIPGRPSDTREDFIEYRGVSEELVGLIRNKLGKVQSF